MKRIQMFMGLILFFIIAVSCSEEATNTLSEGNVQGTETKKVSSEQKVASNQSSTTSSSSIDLEQAVGYVDKDGNAILTLDKDKMIEALEKFREKKSKEKFEYTTAELIAIKSSDFGTYYNLKFVGKRAKTSILIKDIQSYLIVYGTSCTSTVCADSPTECQPQPDNTCSRCVLGACTRTTTSDDCFSCSFLSTYKEYYPKLYEDNIEFLKKVKVYKG